jgi:hypothetical protein
MSAATQLAIGATFAGLGEHAYHEDRLLSRIAEVHATSMKRLSKIETVDDPADGAGDE